MGCCFASCDPCCRRIGCSCKERSDDTFASIDNNRSCTDMPCILVFVAFLIFLMISIWRPAFRDGDPDRIVYGVDYRGRICGKSAGVETKKFAFWPSLTDYRFKVCTNDCEDATSFLTNAASNPNHTNHITVGYPSRTYLDKYCIPTADSGVSIQGFDDYTNEVQRYIADIKTAFPIIFASIGIAFVMSFLYIFLMRMCLSCLVWGTVAAILVGGTLTGIAFVQKANDSELSDSDANLRKGIGYGAFALTAIFFLFIVFARKRIQIAIQVIKSAGRSMKDMPCMVIFPLGPMLVLVSFFIAWIFACIYIFSAGKRKYIDTPDQFIGNFFVAEDEETPVPDTFPVTDYDHTIQNAFAPHFFLLLWVVQICIYFTFATVAGSVADWYFTKRDENGNKIRGNNSEFELSTRPVFSSCMRTFRYHLGTIFYAAFIIAVIQFIRWCVRYMERLMNSSGKEPNKLQKLLFKLVDCFLWCLECCLDKISKNALIWMAIYGDAFCPSVCGSFALIWANIMRLAVISLFSAMVTLLGKVMIPLMTVGFCGLILMNVEPFATDISSPIAPLVVILILALAVAILFLTVYDTAIDTIFLCFLIDEKHNKSSGEMLADPALAAIVQKYSAESKKLAASMKRESSSTIAVEGEAANTEIEI